MTGIEIGIYSVLFMLFMIYIGVYVPIAIMVTSFLGVWFMTDRMSVAINLLYISAEKTTMSFIFGVVPLFVLMGAFVSQAGMGRDTYEVAYAFLRRVRGGLAMTTVVANAIFAAITGVSIASATVFSRIAVPEMLRFNHTKQFAVGTVAGSSVLGMLIPPSVLMIIYALIAEESVGDMFIAGVVPGLILAAAFCVLILIWCTFFRRFAYAAEVDTSLNSVVEEHKPLTGIELIKKAAPIAMLVTAILGGIYSGFFTPTEAGAVGALLSFLIALVRRTLTLKRIWEILLDTGRVTASILFLIIAASMYSRMLGVSGLPTQLGNWAESLNIGFVGLLIIYLAILLVLGTIIDAISIILIAVPLFIVIFEPFGINLIWFGIITIIAVEIGLLTPPLGLSVYVIQSTLGKDGFSLADIFKGAAPFALTMLLVLALLAMFPGIVTVLIDLRG